jgi:hypothetical protein
MLRRFRFGNRGEQLPAGVQGSLLEEAVDEALAEIEVQLQALASRVIRYPRPRPSPSVQRCHRSCPAPRSATNRMM